MVPTASMKAIEAPAEPMMDGYNDAIDRIRENEHSMLRDMTYLDHAGTTLYPKSLMEAFTKDMMSSVYGNPHSASSSSQLSTRRIEDTRLRVLKFFNADPNEFDLIFVANATAGIKMVMDAFRESEGGFWYGYHKDSHTSLVGAREAARAGHHCFTSDGEVEDWLNGHGVCPSIDNEEALGLFAYPAQSNMNGRRLPLSWTQRLKASGYGHMIYSLLDAAALVSTSPLDLSKASAAPDYTVLSFYKIFGFPDLGALIVRKEAAGPLMRRRYFGGGTVDMVACGGEHWHIRKHESLHDQLEDGTLPVHSILALDNALDVHKRLFRSLERISSHTMFLADRLYQRMCTLCHWNGHPICRLYKDEASSYSDSQTQGPIVAFNFMDCQGTFLSNTEVEKLANIRNIQIRSGGLCNPGGIASSLELAPWELRRNFSAGHRCGNENDIVGGKPTGILRVSFGAMSNLRDVETFLAFVEEFFVDLEPLTAPVQSSYDSASDLHVESVHVYPIKSCAAWRIPTNIDWGLQPEGLAWDREWCVVHQGTRKALNQKKFPRMARIRPVIDLDKGLLRIRCLENLSYDSPGEVTVPLSADTSVYEISTGDVALTSQVCGDDIVMRNYESKDIANFFTLAVGTPCTLARFPPTSTTTSARHSKLNLTNQDTPGILRSILLSNESPILTISRSSLNRLNEQIKTTDGKAAHASVFRANIILAENPSTNPGFEKPYAEDDWQSLRIGNDVILDVLGGCRRCQMVCIDQTTAEKNEEPFTTLTKTRRKQGKIYFGVHTALAPGTSATRAKVRVGDRATPVTLVQG